MSVRLGSGPNTCGKSSYLEIPSSRSIDNADLALGWDNPHAHFLTAGCETPTSRPRADWLPAAEMAF
jgi:hypothetical protein